MKTVFVTQVPHRRENGAWIPVMDISPAAEHGKLKIIMPHGPSIVETHDTVKALRSSLEDYDFERGDSLLAIGDPAVIAIAAAIISEYTDKFRLLKWEKTVNRYIPVEVYLQ